MAEFKADELGQDAEEDNDFVVEIGELLLYRRYYTGVLDIVQTSRTPLDRISRVQMKKVLKRKLITLLKEWFRKKRRRPGRFAMPPLLLKYCIEILRTE